MKILSIGLSLLMGTLFLGYQNCSLVNFQSSGIEAENLKLHNGGTYAGLQKGTYYRLLPDHTCQGKPAPYGTLEINGAETKLTINEKDQCASQVKILKSADLARSPYFGEVVGWHAGAYEKKESPPDVSVESDLLEAWCRWDVQSNQEIDSVISYDYRKKTSSGKLILGEKNPTNKDWVTQQSEIASLERKVTFTPQIKSVAYSSPGFKLEIDLSKPAVGRSWLFQGQMTAKTNGQQYNKIVYCRMGGGLDGKNFRLGFTGNSSSKAAVPIRVFNETDSPAWHLSGACDVLLGDVLISDKGLDAPVSVACLPNQGGTFSLDINYDTRAPYFTGGTGGKNLTASQYPAALESTLLFKSLKASPPVFISKASELQSIPPKSGGLYILTKDIDLAQEVGQANNFTPIGNAYNSTGPFTGVFEGNYKTVSNLNINSSMNGLGMFGYVFGTDSAINNLTLEQATISGSNTSSDAAALVATMANGTISNCHANRVNISGTGFRVGGLVGRSDSIKISSSSVSGKISGLIHVGGLVGLVTSASQINQSHSEAQVSGFHYVGGLVGYLGGDGSVINNNYANSVVQGSTSIGGLLGFSSNFTGTLINSYFFGNVIVEQSGTNGGPIIGEMNVPAPVTSLYSSENICRGCDNFNGVGVTSEQFMDRSIFTGWDFSTPIWDLNDWVSKPKIYSREVE